MQACSSWTTCASARSGYAGNADAPPYRFNLGEACYTTTYLLNPCVPQLWRQHVSEHLPSLYTSSPTLGTWDLGRFQHWVPGPSPSNFDDDDADDADNDDDTDDDDDGDVDDDATQYDCGYDHAAAADDGDDDDDYYDDAHDCDDDDDDDDHEDVDDFGAGHGRFDSMFISLYTSCTFRFTYVCVYTHIYRYIYM